MGGVAIEEHNKKINKTNNKINIINIGYHRLAHDYKGWLWFVKYDKSYFTN